MTVRLGHPCLSLNTMVYQVYSVLNKTNITNQTNRLTVVLGVRPEDFKNRTKV